MAEHELAPSVEAVDLATPRLVDNAIPELGVGRRVGPT
jgi:hypothetical protein